MGLELSPKLTQNQNFFEFFYEGMSKIASTQIVPLKHVFVKPNEQAKHRLSYAMARKRRMKFNPERDGASQCQKGKNRIFAILSFCVEQ